jgi:hypothetical protein
MERGSGNVSPFLLLILNHEIDLVMLLRHNESIYAGMGS